MWLPKPFYEMLPLLYVLLGLAAIGAAAAFTHGSLGATVFFFIGLIWSVLGMAIWLKRRFERSSREQRKMRQLELFGPGE